MFSHILEKIKKDNLFNKIDSVSHCINVLVEANEIKSDPELMVLIEMEIQKKLQELEKAAK